MNEKYNLITTKVDPEYGNIETFGIEVHDVMSCEYILEDISTDKELVEDLIHILNKSKRAINIEQMEDLLALILP